MLSLKDLNKAIDVARDKDNIDLINDVMHSFRGFEQAITETAAAGNRTGTYIFKLSACWAIRKVHNVAELIENELKAQYSPICITVESYSVGSQGVKPFIGVEFIIPGEKNMEPEDYGYQMKERGNWE